MESIPARRALILKRLTEDYAATGKPVGSKRLVQITGLRLSTATIRSELQRLEKDDYVTHIFTSSGRVPTDKGYRYYVDNFLDLNQLTFEERKSVFDYFYHSGIGFEEILENSTAIIAKMLSAIGLASARSRTANTIKHIDLVQLSIDELLVVLISEKGLIGKRVIKAPVVDNDLNSLERLLNEKFIKLDACMFRKKAADIASLLTPSKLFEQVCGAIEEILTEQQARDFYYKGTNYLADYPEVADPGHFKAVLSVLDEKDIILSDLYDVLEIKPFVIKIGGENGSKIKDFSVVAASIKQKDSLVGAIGILGPRRMNYSKAVASVCCIADNVSNYLTTN